MGRTYRRLRTLHEELEIMMRVIYARIQEETLYIGPPAKFDSLDLLTPDTL